MVPDERYPIEVYMMTENRCYKAGRKIAPIVVQVHSVGCKGTDRDRWRRWNNPNIDKCPNAFLDTKGIMQTLPWDCRPWLSGKSNVGNANDFSCGFEMCEPSTANDTPEAAAYLYGCALYLCTQLCIDYGILPNNVLCHAELHKLGVASNHADVTHWWGKKGTSWEPYTMSRLRSDVASNLLALGLPTKAEELPANRLPTIKKGYVGEEVRYLQRLLTENEFATSSDGMFGSGTEGALKKFQSSKHLSVDGVCGGKTWSALITTPTGEPTPPTDEDIESVTLPLADVLSIKASLQTALNLINKSIEKR